MDILTAVDGLEFAAAWDRRVTRPLGRAKAPVLSMDDLIHNKRLVGRPQDLVDVQHLERRRALDASEGRASERTATPRRMRARSAAPVRARKAGRKAR